ncbi:MAG: arginyltransferase [Pseudomonadota bacterium]
MTTEPTAQSLGFFRTQEHACPYLADEQATNVLADPAWPMDTAAYAVLLANGFRRSGDHVYRPGCARCTRCIPVRIPVATFRPSRSQRRSLKLNADVECRVVKPSATDAYLALYKRYLDARHVGSDMASADKPQFLSFLGSSWCETVFVEMWVEGQLVGVAVTDQAGDALSAVYTFFDPLHARRAFGTLAILLQLRLASEHRFKWLYLGYAILSRQNMAYKTAFRPQQHFIDGVWREPRAP